MLHIRLGIIRLATGRDKLCADVEWNVEIEHNSRAREAEDSVLDVAEHGIFSLPRPRVVFYLNIPFDIRAELVAARGEPDYAEADVQHQKSADECALFLEKNVPGWKRIECVNETGALRAPIAINREILDIVRPLIGR